MSRYRIFFFDSDHRIQSKFIIDGESDDAVVDRVRSLRHAHRAEIYRDGELIERIEGALVIRTRSDDGAAASG